MLDYQSKTVKSPDEAGESAPNPVFAWSITVMLIILGLLMAGSIYWRWATVHEPSSAVVVIGDVSLDGAAIQVSDGAQKWDSKLDHFNGWQSPLLLDPGNYSISVKHHDREILHEDFVLHQLRGFEEKFTRHPLTGLEYELPSMVMVIGGPLVADAKVEIRAEGASDADHPEEVRLNSAEDYRSAVYLNPGSYVITARSRAAPDRIIARQAFVVDRTAPVEVDITKPMERWQR